LGNIRNHTQTLTFINIGLVAEERYVLKISDKIPSVNGADFC